MSNLPPAMFVGLLKTLKMIFWIEKSKIHVFHVVFTVSKWRFRPVRGQQVLRLLPKKATYVAKNFGCCKGRSKVSVDIFMGSGNLLVAQKISIFVKKSSKKRNTVPPD